MIAFLSSIGDSIVAIKQGTIVKIHVHTKVPYKAIEYAQRYGEFVTFKMENMSIQHNEVLAQRNADRRRQDGQSRRKAERAG
jgi:dihydroxyacetone kinase-like predicted kinase